MIKKVGLSLAVMGLAALSFYAFYGWRVAAFELLPIGLPMC
ncbi:hypothetical protein ACBP46_07495 [Paenalcaligenes hominis]